MNEQINENIGEQNETARKPRRKVGETLPTAEQSESQVTQPSPVAMVVPAFEPSRYLMKIEGRDYLEVKWRLLWLRTEHPEARIVTALAKHEDGFALFRAKVIIPGGGSATGWGSETARDFNDYIEAAETKALGRALAALGYGTQFCQDYDFAAVAEPGRAQVVDSPVNFTITDFGQSYPARSEKQTSDSGYAASSNGNGQPAANRPFTTIQGNSNGMLTEKQLKAIYAIARNQRAMSENEVDALCLETYGTSPANLNKAEASRFIDILKQQAAA